MRSSIASRALLDLGRVGACLLVVAALAACGDDDAMTGRDGGSPPGTDLGPVILPDGAVADLGQRDGGGVCVPQIEICGDHIDQNCDGRETSCGDTDGDGIDACRNAAEVAAMTCDCDDSRIDVRPAFGTIAGAAEICDGLDNDCNGRIDESAACCAGCASLGTDRSRADLCNAAGECVCSTASGMAVCAPGQTCCSSGCVDTTSDFGNCGACGAACTNQADHCAASNCACGSGPVCDYINMCSGGHC